MRVMGSILVKKEGQIACHSIAARGRGAKSAEQQIDIAFIHYILVGSPGQKQNLLLSDKAKANLYSNYVLIIDHYFFSCGVFGIALLRLVLMDE